MKLKDRIKKLELTHSSEERSEVDLIRIHILSADQAEHIDNALWLIEGAGSKWLRHDGEPEDAFIERALSAARAMRPGARIVCMGFPELA